MDRNQERTFKLFGYAFEELPNMKTIPRMTFITPEGKELPNLPADEYHLKRYLSRGFRPKTPEPQFVCEVCGKELSCKIALSGHSRTHKNLEKGG